jgi:isopenicillin-N epimerase
VRTDLGWRLDPSVTFLNHGSYGACPEPVLAVQREWRDRLETAPVRFLSHELPGHLAEAREAIAAFLGADAAGLAFVPNATTGVNTVLQSLRFDPGDELLTTDHEYNATINALQAVAARDGARVVVSVLPFPGTSDDTVVDAVLGAVTPRTRLALLSHITSTTGLIMPIERLVSALLERGVETLVDAAHAPGQVPVDLLALGAAYWTGNGHKWLCGPKGAGMLWVRPDRRETIHPLVVSHGANEPLAGSTRFRWEFDWTGTTDPSPYLTLPEAIGWMAAQAPGGWPEIRAANHAMVIAGRDRLTEALGLASPVPDAMLGSMAAVPVPGIAGDADAAALSQRLYDEHRIEVPIGGWPVRAARPAEAPPRQIVLRVSAQRYNEAADYVALATALGADPAVVPAGAGTRR